MQGVGLPVAESADEQQSTLQQGRHLGLSGVGGVDAIAGSWTARGRGLLLSRSPLSSEASNLAAHCMCAAGHRCPNH